METRTYKSNYDADEVIEMKYGTYEFTNSRQFLEAVLVNVSEKIADELIKHHLPEILEKISVEALANMTIAQAGAEINKTLKEKIPDKILHVETEKATVYQKGIFGGLKKIA